VKLIFVFFVLYLDLYSTTLMKLKFTLPSLTFLMTLTVLFVCTCLKAQTSISSRYSFSQTQGTYTPLSSPQILSNEGAYNLEIGFAFYFDDRFYSRFGITSEGWLYMGSESFFIPIPGPYSPLNFIDNNDGMGQIISVLGGYNSANPTGSLGMQLSGTAPFRVLTIEWNDYPNVGSNFQVQLCESTGVIKFIYDNLIGSGQVGIMGDAGDLLVRTNYTFNQQYGSITSTTPGLGFQSCSFDTSDYTPGFQFLFTPVNTPGPGPAHAVDLQLVRLDFPNSHGCSANSVPLRAVVYNAGRTTHQFALSALTFNITCTGPVAVPIPSATIASTLLGVGDSAVFIISNSMSFPTQGNYVFNGTIGVTNDSNSANDTLPTQNVNFSIINTFPYTEGFSNGLPAGYSMGSGTLSPGWTIIGNGAPAAGMSPMLNPGYVFVDDNTSFPYNNSAMLITPCFDFSVINIPILEVRLSGVNFPANDEIVFWYSTDQGFSWNAAGGATTVDNLSQSTVHDWRTHLVDLSYNCSGLNGVRLAIQYVSNGGQWVAIDQIKVFNDADADIMPLALVSPVSFMNNTGAETVAVTVKNNAATPVDFGYTPLTLRVSITGASTQSFTSYVVSGILAPNATQTFTVTTTCNLLNQGTHQFRIITQCNDDTLAANDTLMLPIQVAYITSIPYQFSFAAANPALPITQITGSGNWNIVAGNLSSPQAAPNNPAPANNYYALFDSPLYAAGTTSRLTVPRLNLTYVTNASLDFVLLADATFPAANDRVEIRVSTNGGQTWGPVVFTANRYDAAYTTPAQKTFKFCLSAYAGQSNVRIAFDAVGQGGGALRLDDIRFYNSVNAQVGSISSSASVVCSGNAVSLQLNGTLIGNIQWQTAPTSMSTFTNIAGANAATYTMPSASSTAFYRAVATNADACLSTSTSGALGVTVNPLPVVNLGPDATFCGSVVLNAQNAGATYQWSDSTTTQTLSASTSGTYSVTVTNAFNCTTTDAINVTINPVPAVNLGADITQCGGSVTLDAQNAGATYQWSDSTTAQTLNASTSGTYSVTVTNAFNCATSDAINVTINPVPAVNLGADITQCGGSITLDAQNAGATYQWSDSTTAQTLNASTSGTYSVTVTNAFNCATSDAINVTINPVSTVNLGADITQCGGSVTLDAQNAGAIYQWSDSTTAQTLNASTSGTYSVTVTNAFNCATSDAINVTINPVPTVNLGADITQCGGNVTLDAQNAGATYQWSDSTTAQTLNASTSGTYSVTVTNAFNCAASDVVNIVLHNLPAVSLVLAQDTFCNNGNTVVLSGGVPSGGLYSGPGVSNGIYDPFSSGNGTHTILYTYTDSNSCTSTALQLIYTDVCNGSNQPTVAQFGLYPNPTNGNVLLVVGQPLDVSGVVEIYAVNGSVVFEQQLNSGTTTVLLPTEMLAKGIYLVRFTSGQAQTQQRLIIDN
jgi:Secretion system C-terminal sorting domain